MSRFLRDYSSLQGAMYEAKSLLTWDMFACRSSVGWLRCITIRIDFLLGLARTVTPEISKRSGID